jgi:hypothetical protein
VDNAGYPGQTKIDQGPSLRDHHYWSSSTYMEWYCWWS